MRTSRLGIEIALLLLLKGALLFALWALFFAHRPDVDAAAVGARLTRSP